MRFFYLVKGIANCRLNGRERGVALVLVIFVIALLSALVVNLAYSTSVGATLSANMQRSTQAEYILKSALNFALVLLKHDKTPEDSPKDIWGKFINGVAIPPDMLGIPLPNVHIELQISPEDRKFPLNAVVPSGFSTPDQKWVQALLNLYQSPTLNFDGDKELDHTGYFSGKHFDASQMVGILVDYMDADEVSFEPGGIESSSDLPSGFFANQPLRRIGELASLPGYTPARVRKLMLVTSALGGLAGGGIYKININVAPAAVLKCLSQQIDDNMVQAIIDFRNSEDGPFTLQNMPTKLPEILGDQNLVREVQIMAHPESKWFEIIAKVDYGTSRYLLRAYALQEVPQDLPTVQSVELF